MYLVWLLRAMLRAVALLLVAGLAAPQTSSLTTIQDTLLLADGARFNGSLRISWSTFDATLGTIVQQSETVPVVSGILYVQLAPNVAANPPANLYTVLYQSDGYQQFTETWTVPSSVTPLAVAQVRVSTTSGSLLAGGGANAGGSTGGASSSTVITEANVTGLTTDLQQRPVKGPSYANGAVAIIDVNGQLEAAAGTPGSCVMVDGTTGPCGTGGPAFVDAEIPGGAVNGANSVFTLQNSPSTGSLMLFRNGLYMLAGLDYTLTGSTIQFQAASTPRPGDTLAASYRLPNTTAAPLSTGGGSSAGAQTASFPQILCSGAGLSTSSTSWTQLGSCAVPAGSMAAGSRIEIRFTLAHTGAASGFSFEADWGSTAIVSRQASPQDAAVALAADAAVGSAGSTISAQSWGSVLSFLPGIVNAGAQSGVTIGLKAMLASSGSDSVTLANYTVLLY